MEEPLSAVEFRAQTARARLAAALRAHPRLVYANSLGAEAMVLTDIIWTHLPAIEMFSIDTGRLPQETYDLMEALQRRYRRRLQLVHPDAAALGRLTALQGVNGFYASLEARIECCRVRKVEPFTQAVAGYDGWVTGVRQEHSPARARARLIEWDEIYGLYKVSPLLDWTADEVWRYIRARGLPYNALHDRRFTSIGCLPCTRAVRPGEAPRAGRWWWERPETRECGLHPTERPATSRA